MKALVATLALLVGFQAQATSIQIGLAYVLPTVEINKKATNFVGDVKVNLHEQYIELDIYKDPCGTLTAKPGEVTCKAMPMLVDQVSVKFQKRTQDACGTVIYSGKEDRRPVDGPLTKIQVVDNTYNTCEMVLPFRVQVTAYQEFVSRMGQGKSIKKTIKATLK
jgi:hypothetical protein